MAANVNRRLTADGGPQTATIKGTVDGHRVYASFSATDGAVLATLGARWQEIETKSYDYNTGARLSRYKSDAVTPVFALISMP